MERDELYDVLEKLGDIISTNYAKKMTDFLLSRQKFVDMLQDLVDRSNLSCEIENMYIGEVSMAKIDSEDQTYVAIDCVIRRNKYSEWHGDTLFVPIELMTEKNPNENFMCKFRLLSIEAGKEQETPRVLN